MTVDPQGNLLIGDRRVVPGGALGPFRYTSHLATGSSAEVVAAVNDEGKPVALKMLKGVGIDAEVQRRFLREVEALGRLDHPHVVALRGQGELWGVRYIALELIEGRGFEEVLHLLPHLPPADRWAEIVRLTSQIADALQHIHRRGMVHRDLKPANLRIDRAGLVRLTDFGVAKELGGQDEEVVVGTWAYASPEQVNGQSLDHRSDLYSLGVLLYQMLTGKRPFTAATFSGYTSLHLRAEPEAPHRFDPDIPGYLEAAALRLLKKAPRERFQSAQELLHFLRWEGSGAQELVETSGPPLYDREAELAEMSEAVSALLRGTGGVIMIEGPEGCGRTRLLDHLCAQVAAVGVTVHRFDAAAEALEALHGFAVHLRDGLGARCPAALQAAVAGFAEAGDPRQRLFDGVRRGLNVYLDEGPLLVAVDDLHQAPGSLGALLGFLGRTTLERDRRPLLIVATRRTHGPVSPASPTANGVPVRVLRPGPHSPASLRAMAAAIPALASEAERLGPALYAATEGHPRTTAQYLLAWEEAGGLPIDEDGRDIVGANLKIPARVRQAAISRIGALLPEDRELLSILAVAGKDMEQEVLVELAGGVSSGALARVDRLTDRRVLVQQTRAGRAIVDFSARPLGQAFYWETPPVLRATLHRRVALALARRRGRMPYGPEVIGEHFRRAGDVGPAFVHLSIAALALWERGLHMEAEAVANRAEGLEPLAEGNLEASLLREGRVRRLRVQVGMMLHRGAFRLALGEAEAVRAEAQRLGDPVTLTEASLAVATALFGIGQADRAIRLAEDVLRGARDRADRRGQLSSHSALASFALDLGDLPGVERIAAAALQVGVEGETDPVLLDLRLTRALALALSGQVGAARQQLSEAEVLVRRIDDQPRLALLHARRAELLLWQGELGAAARRIEAAERIAREIDHAPASRLATRMRAELCFALGDAEGLRQALHSLHAQMADGSGHRELGAIARLGVLQAIVEQRWADADERARNGLQATSPCDGEAVGADIQALLALTLIRRGRIEVAEPLLRDLGRIVPRIAGARRPEVQIHMAAAWAALGYREAAIALASTARESARARGFRLAVVRANLLIADQGQGAEVGAALTEATTLVREVLGALGPGLAHPFRAHPDVARLLHTDAVA